MQSQPWKWPLSGSERVEGGNAGWYQRIEKKDKPTKKGISLILMRWKNLVHQLKYADAALQRKRSYGHHIGGNVCCNVAENGVCVDIRQYWKPQEELVPNKKGICLRSSEYDRLKELLPEIGNALPELRYHVSFRVITWTSWERYSAQNVIRMIITTGEQYNRTEL